MGWVGLGWVILWVGFGWVRWSWVIRCVGRSAVCWTLCGRFDGGRPGHSFEWYLDLGTVEKGIRGWVSVRDAITPDFEPDVPA